MRTHNSVLCSLVMELLGSEAAKELRRLAMNPYLTYDQVAEFDLRLGGTSLERMNCGNTGRFDIADRDVLRPLQYCGMYFEKGFRENDLAWFARTIVQMSGLHLESLVKRVGRLGPLPLGTLAAWDRAPQRASAPPCSFANLGTDTEIRRHLQRREARRHAPKDTHLYSVEDALLAYCVSRRLGAALYPLARLATDWTIFDEEC